MSKKSIHSWQTAEALAERLGVTPTDVRRMADEEEPETAVERKDRTLGTGYTKTTFRVDPGDKRELNKPGFHYVDAGNVITVIANGRIDAPVLTLWSGDWGGGRIDMVKAAAVCLNALNANFEKFDIEPPAEGLPKPAAVIVEDEGGES